jgi:hypothetical protein
MQCFPQLLTGASGQFPIRKRATIRTVRNQCLDGREIKLPDPPASSIEWQLAFAELTDDERASLEQFFLAMEGSLNTFTFLDPTDNLLAWSEGFNQAAWQADPLLGVVSGTADPLGGTTAFRVTNPAGAPLRILQTLNVPGGYYYALSVWARSDAAPAVTLHRGDQAAQAAIGPGWRRLVLAAASSAAGSSTAFGFEIAPGASVDVFGAQVEAQTGASGYKKTTTAGGVYPATRFRDNRLAFTTLAPGRHGCAVHLRTN